MDPITFSVLQSAFKSIVDEMNISMFRSAYSPVITEGRDIGGAIFDREGHLVAQGESDLAVFVTMLEYSCQAIIQKYKDDIYPGDVFISNDPFVGGTHFNDVEIIKPVFVGGNLIGLVAIVGHWPDVGGSTPGSFAPDAEEYYQEGLRIPPIKLISKGEKVQGVYDMIMANVRIPSDRAGDLRAQISAVQIGAERLVSLVERYGEQMILTCMQHTIDYSRRLMENEIAQLPDGRYSFTEYLDRESKHDDSPVKVFLTMTIRGNQMTFDFTGSDAQTRSATNSTFSSTASAVIVALKSLFPDIPMNHGCFIPIEFIIPEGTVVNAKAPAAISAMAATVYERVIGVTLGALAQATPEKITACPYSLINLTIGGVDPQTDQFYVSYLFSEGGFGGRYHKDGSSGLVSLFGGGARITPVEVFERKYPIMFSEWSLRPDSGGAGKFRGGNGSRKTFTITRGHARLTALGDREKFPPWGLDGGKPGLPQRLLLNADTDQEVDLTLKANDLLIQAGRPVTVLTGGGGGYGDPLERDVQLVLEDVLQEEISIEHAREHYGVVIDAENNVDEQATRLLREQIRRGGGASDVGKGDKR